LFVGAVNNAAIHTAILVIIALCIPVLFASFASSIWDLTIGNLSYPVYLVHMLIIQIAGVAFHIRSGIVVAILSLASALIIIRYLEEPIDRYRQRRVQGNPEKRLPDVQSTASVSVA
jgi:peptidoglycan/LPS O-acetylase OafA/YrhL